MIRLTIRLTSPKNNFLRASVALCPKKVILVVNLIVNLIVNLYVNQLFFRNNS